MVTDESCQKSGVWAEKQFHFSSKFQQQWQWREHLQRGWFDVTALHHEPYACEYQQKANTISSKCDKYSWWKCMYKIKKQFQHLFLFAQINFDKNTLQCISGKRLLCNEKTLFFKFFYYLIATLNGCNQV